MKSEKVISNIKKAIKEHLDNNYAYDMLVDFELDVIDWNSLFEYIDKLQQENQQLKDNWNKLKQIIDVKMYNSEYLINLCGYKVDVDTLEILKIIKKEMQELEKGDIND